MLRVALNVWNVEAFGLQCALTEGGREEEEEGGRRRAKRRTEGGDKEGRKG